MPRLTDTTIRAAKPKDRPFKLYDTDGLYLQVDPNNRRRWYFRWRAAGKEKRIGIGPYPLYGLKDARRQRTGFLKQLEKGLDPLEERRLEKLAAKQTAENTFARLAEDYLEHRSGDLAPKTLEANRRMLEKHLLPWLGDKPATTITPQDLLRVLNRIGKPYTMRRARALVGRIYRFGIAEGRAERDIAADIVDALPAHNQTHRAAVTDPREVGALLRKLDTCDGTFVTRCALRLAPLLMLRPSELRMLQWDELDRGERLFRISEQKMKMRREHLVPLSDQALTILDELEPLTGRGKYLFPHRSDPRKPMSNGTLNAALRRLGIDTKTEMTGHGFRAMAATLLRELGWDPDVIEIAQARIIPGVRGVYDRAKHLVARRKMFQEWADYLDPLRWNS